MHNNGIALAIDVLRRNSRFGTGDYKTGTVFVFCKQVVQPTARGRTDGEKYQQCRSKKRPYENSFAQFNFETSMQK
jgi:hypothetical protein